jgi:hypothetical protein
VIAPTSGWDSYEWEEHCRTLLRLRYGVDFVPVPDKVGGDGGLDGFVRRKAVAWQFYAPEGEPLTPTKRYARQRDKITADLQKMVKYRDRVHEILGDLILHDWVLLTPVHESADLIPHCNGKAKDARGWNLPFLSPDFNVSVQDLVDFRTEHATSQQSGLLPASLRTPLDLPELMADGSLFSNATGERIDRMDGKLAKILPDPDARAYFRGELLKSKYARDDLLDRYDTRVPDIAHRIRYEIGQAKRAMLMSQACGVEGNNHFRSVQDDISSRIKDAAEGIPRTQSSYLAEGTVCDWLEECSMGLHRAGVAS